MGTGPPRAHEEISFYLAAPKWGFQTQHTLTPDRLQTSWTLHNTARDAEILFARLSTALSVCSDLRRAGKAVGNPQGHCQNEGGSQRQPGGAGHQPVGLYAG